MNFMINRILLGDIYLKIYISMVIQKKNLNIANE